MPLPRTYVATPKDIEKKWILVDAEGVVLGRLAGSPHLLDEPEASLTWIL